MSNTRRTPKTLAEAQAAALAHPLVGAILAADDRPYEDVEVPEWGNIKVRIRGADGRGLDRHETSMFKMRAGTDGDMALDAVANYRARLLAECLYDPETDERLPINADQLGGKSGRVVARLFAIALRLSGAGPKAVEDAEGNSGAAQSGSSISG